MNLEALAVRRADEQMHTDAWKTVDQPLPGAACRVCGGPLKRKGAVTCKACSRRGWRPTPCPRCGSPTHVNDRTRVVSGEPCRKCKPARVWRRRIHPDVAALEGQVAELKRELREAKRRIRALLTVGERSAA